MYRRVAFFVIALLATAVIASLGVISFERELERFTPLGFDAVFEQGLWRVQAVEAAATGLRPNDRILWVDRREVSADRSQLRVLLHDEPESTMAVYRGEELLQVRYVRPANEVDYAYLALCVIGCFYLLIGLYAAIKDGTGPARLFVLWCLTSAALFILSPPPMPVDRADLALELVDQTARNLLPALTLHLFLIFPAGLATFARIRFAIPLLYLPAAVFLSLRLDLMSGGGRIAGELTAAKLLLLDRLELTHLVAFSLLAVVALAVRLARHDDWEPRRQAQWVIAGMLAGYTPFLLLYLVPTVLGWSWPRWVEVPALVPLAFIPLSFAYAIFKYRLWDLGAVLRDTVAYSLTALVGVFGFVLISRAIDQSLGAELTMLRNLLSFTAGLSIAAVLVPAKSAIANGFERLQFRGRLSQRRALLQLGERLVYERDLDRLCDRLLRGLAEGLGLERVNLYLAQGEALVPVRPEERIPRLLAMDALGERLWRGPALRLGITGLSFDAPTPQQRLVGAGYYYALPLKVRDQHIGLVLFGHRQGEMPLSSEDLDLARGLLNQAALAIENAQLLDEVNRQLREVIRLEAHSKGIIESSPAGIAVLDDEQRVTSANLAFAAIVGAPRPAVVGRELASLLPVRPLPAIGDGMVEVSYCEPNGRERYLQLSVAAHRDGDASLRVLVVQDVSERMAMEQTLKEKERLASLGMLAAGVAHEVNTPLTGISSYAQLLLDDLPADDSRREILKKMERQSFRASQIVNNLLQFARNREAVVQDLDLARIVDESLEPLHPRARDAGVTIDWTPPAERVAVAGNEGELIQVVTNLTVNAIDAMAGQDGSHDRRLTLALEALDDRVALRVGDTGPGIAPARLERIFQPFYSSKLDNGGTGLGLAITYNIVRRHGGEIRADNRVGSRGCIFTVSLPRHRSRS